MTSKERIYATLKGDACDRVAVTPILMAWAAHFIGRTYRDYYLDGDVLVEAQLAVVKAFNLDQASAISDPWREASAYGMQFDYPPDGVGRPKNLLIKNRADVSRLGRIDVKNSPRTKQRIESVGTMASRIGGTHSVLGWVEGPLAEYSDLRGVENAMLDLIDAPEVFIKAGRIIIDNAVAFALAQIQAGADMVGIGDSAASLISPAMYAELVMPLEARLIAAIHDAGAAAKLHVCGNITNIIQHIAKTGTDVIDVDWMVPLRKARELAGPDVTLCGNFNPAGVLFEGTPQQVAEAARECLKDASWHGHLGRGFTGWKPVPRFILMPGCEVPPGTPEANLRAFCPLRTPPS